MKPSAIFHHIGKFACFIKSNYNFDCYFGFVVLIDCFHRCIGKLSCLIITRNQWKFHQPNHTFCTFTLDSKPWNIMAETPSPRKSQRTKNEKTNSWEKAKVSQRKATGKTAKMLSVRQLGKCAGSARECEWQHESDCWSDDEMNGLQLRLFE